MLPGLRMVRTNAVPAKLPQYVQELDPESDAEANKWPSGLFVWQNAEPGNAGRTAFSLKAKPHTAQKAADAMMSSRHERAGANEGETMGPAVHPPNWRSSAPCSCSPRTWPTRCD